MLDREIEKTLQFTPTYDISTYTECNYLYFYATTDIQGILRDMNECRVM